MFCKHCGTDNADDAAFCPKCGARPGASAASPPPAAYPDSALKWIAPSGVPVLPSRRGIYPGLFSVLLLPAPLALLFGVLALADIAKHPEKSGKGRAWFGIVTGVLFSLALVLFAVAMNVD